MTNQNNAAQAAILALMLPEQPGLATIVDAGYAAYRRGYNSAIGDAARVLSKLRAEGVQAGDERAAFEIARRKRDADAPLGRMCLVNNEEYTNSEDQAAWEGWQDRAAQSAQQGAGG